MRFGLPAQAPVVSCYEAGRDGFWIHRALTQLGVAQSGRRFGEHRGESAGAAREDGSARCAEAGADAGAGVLRRAEGVERSARPDGGGGGGAPGQSRADGVDAGADAADQSNARLAGDVGVRAAARRQRGWWTAVRDWAGAPLPVEVQTRLARAEARRAVLERQIAELDAQQQAAVTRRGAGECVAPVGAAEGRRDDERVGVAGRRPGVARVPQSAPDRRVPGLCADPYDSGESDAGARDQSGGQRAPAVDEHSAGVELGALATAQRADAVVSGAIRDRESARGGLASWRSRASSLIALWRYVTTGVVPAGAILKVAAIG